MNLYVQMGGRRYKENVGGTLGKMEELKDAVNVGSG